MPDFKLKELDFNLKLILTIVYDFYGIARRLTCGNTVSIIVAIVQIITGNLFGILWIVDFITLFLNKEITVFVDGNNNFNNFIKK